MKFKDVRFTLFISIALTLIGCDKGKLPFFDFYIYSPGPQETGSASAVVYGKKWEATAEVRPGYFDPEFLSIYFLTYSEEGFNRDQLFFGLFSLQEGEYKLVSSDDIIPHTDFEIQAGYEQLQDDGDVLNGKYRLDEDFDQFFVINEIDTNLRLIRGRFEIQFLLDEKYYHRDDLAIVLRFEGGEFEVTY